MQVQLDRFSEGEEGLTEKLHNQNWEKYKEWIKENGGFIHESLNFVEIDSETEYRGVFAEKFIPAKELLWRIPGRITHRPQFYKVQLPVLWQKIKERSICKHCSLAIALAYSRKYTDLLSPWIRSLPENINYLPIFWTERYRNMLNGTWAHRYIKTLKRRTKKVLPMLGEFNITAEEFNWAYGTSISRSFGFNYTLMGGEDFVSAIPVGFDFANHQATSSGQVLWDPAEDHSVFSLKEPIQENTELFFNYGSKSDDTMIAYYGFLEDSNDNYIFIKLDLTAVQSIFLDLHKLPKYIKWGHGGYGGLKHNEKLSLKICALKDWNEKEAQKIILSKTITDEVLDLQMRLCMIKSCQNARQKFDTTLEQDRKSLINILHTSEDRTERNVLTLIYKHLINYKKSLRVCSNIINDAATLFKEVRKNMID